MTKTYTFRLTAEGLTDLKAQMDALGNDGKAAFQKIVDATPGMSGALDLVQQRAEQARQKMHGAAGGMHEFSEAAGVAKEVLGAFGVALSLGGLIEFGKGVFEDTAHLVDQARQLGVNTDALQTYRAVLKDSGASADDANTLIYKLSQTLGQAEVGSLSARQAFSRLGVDWRALGQAADPVKAAVQSVSQAILNIQDPFQRADAQMAFFGKTSKEIGAALPELAGDIDKVTQSLKEQGRIYDAGLAQKSKEASDKITAAMDQLKVTASPSVVVMTDNLTRLLQTVEALSRADFKTAAKGLGELAAHSVFAKNMGEDTGISDHDPAQKPFIYADPAGGPSGVSASLYQDQAIQKLKEEAALAKMTADQRAVIAAQLDLANAKLKDGNVSSALSKEYADKQAETQEDINKILTQQEKAHAANLGHQIAAGQIADKLKETYQGFLASLGEEARFAGETANQRKIELETIKAAQIVQKERGDKEKELVQTYDAAREILGKKRTLEIASAAAAPQEIIFAKQLKDELTLSTTALTAGTDQRQLALSIAQKELELGRQLTDVEKDRLALIEKQNDEAGLQDQLQGMREEVQLAGMLPEEAERYAAVLQAVHATHGNITDDQKQEIEQLIQARQEAEKFQQLLQSIQGGFENFFSDILTKGKLDFGDLFRSIEASFAQMLAQMAAQAIAQPIIMPMIESVMGSGGLGLLGGGGGGGAGGALSSLGSLGSLGGGSSLFGDGGIGGAIDGLGMSLGFGATPIAASSFAIPGLAGGAIDLPALDVGGSIFGTSLGGFLGGAGIGALAGNLIFGNKNDASTGSMGGAAMGAAIGSIIPGIGTIIGGLLGGVLGGGLGSMTGSSNQSSIANLTNGGQNYAIVQQGSQQNTGLATQAAQAINQAVTALTKAGVSLTNDISGVGIGSEKDYIYYQSGEKQKLGSKADPNDVVNQVLNHLLGSAASSDSNISNVIANYKGQGGVNTSNLQQFLTDIGFAQSVKDIDFGEKQLSQAGQALKTINDQFDQAIQKAQALGVDTAQIEAARQTAVQGLIDDFNDGIEASLRGITDPIAASFDTLVKSQQTRLQNAQDLGADIEQVIALNGKETQAAFQQYFAPLQQLAAPALSNFAAQIDAITKAADQARDAAAALGLGFDDVNEAAARAYQSVRDNFNDGITGSITKLLDPAAAAYNDMLRVQAQRIADATSVGGDLNDVMRLNALETDAYYTAQAKAAADALAQQQAAQAQQEQQSADLAEQMRRFNVQTHVSYLNITDSLAGALAAEDESARERLDQARQLGADLIEVEALNAAERQKIIDDANDKQLSAIKAQAQAEADTQAQAAATALRQLQSARSGLSGLIQDLIAGPSSGLSPDQKYFTLLSQFNQAATGVSGSPNDPNAIANFSSTAQALLPVAREFLGTSQSYGNLTSRILATATSIGGADADPSGVGRAIVQAQAAGAGAIVEAVGTTNDTITELKDQIARLNTLIQAMLAKAA
jgi:hypothetical protein